MRPHLVYDDVTKTKKCPHCNKDVRISFVICPKCHKEITKVEPVSDSPDGANFTPIGEGVIKQQKPHWVKS